MDQILQSVSSLVLLSLLDGFFRYSQVLVTKDDCLKTTFQTKWGTFTYAKMQFGLIIVGATFKWAMDIAFQGHINRFVVV